MVDFAEIERLVFRVSGDKVFIGGVEVTPQMRDVLRDQARSLATSQLWEILHASIVNESANLALIQSTEWEHVQFAKALKHYAHFINNVIHTLAK